jgi:hypothetical protein
MSQLTPECEVFFKKHAVNLKVAAVRPYVRWTLEDLTPVQDAYQGLAAGGQRAHMTRLAKQRNRRTDGNMVRIARQSDIDNDDPTLVGGSGRVITRCAPPGLSLPHVYAEIRPDWSVWTEGPQWHYHGDEPVPEGIPDYQVFSPKVMRDHIDRGSDPENPKEADAHRGVNSQEYHSHQRWAKYVFPPNEKYWKPYMHIHDTYGLGYKGLAYRGDAAWLEYHLMDEHDSADHVAGRHLHYSYELKPDGERLAKRIDVHPWALDLFASAEAVFFVIEGCIKADAVLSAGYPVFSVPSVTLWNADELPAFARHYLAGKTVLIVPDADGIKNPRVMEQARACRLALERMGLRAYVTSPPYARYKEDRSIKGIDDYLAADGDIAALDVDTREASELTGRATVALEMLINRDDRVRRDGDMLDTLIEIAKPDGTLRKSKSALARISGMSRGRVSDALDSLESFGLITKDGDFKEYRNRRGAFMDEGPTITLRLDLRAKRTDPLKLGEVLPALRPSPAATWAS